MFDKKEKCTSIVEGKIVSFKSKGLEHPSIITVEYEIDNVKYQIQETVKLKRSVIKLGFIPIGQRATPTINTKVGSIIQVKYNPDNPNESYIVGNDGLINCC